ncbi:hypothetical protein VTH82DRAFT_1599 [Thermothelomyces myriococcoides]
MRTSTILLGRLGALASIASATTHHLFVGNLVPPAAIYALKFDDETNDFAVLKNNTADASHAWITFDHAKKNMYGASLNETRIASYRVLNETTVELTRHINATGACYNTTSPFVVAMPTEPHLVFTASWPGPAGCAMSLGVSSRGVLNDTLYSWSYTNESAVHGLALAPMRNNNNNSTISNSNNSTSNRQLVYSADLKGNLIWTHSVDPTTGRASEVGRFPAPKEGDHPRHLEVHPNGERLYVVLEAGNAVVEYAVDRDTGAVSAELGRHSLLPPDVDPEQYWSAEVMLGPPVPANPGNASHGAGAGADGGRYLWATARAEEEDAVGYVSAFLIGHNGGIVKRMFRVPTPTTGGIANAVSPAPWSHEYAAMTDFGTGYVLMWKMEGRKDRDDGLVEYETAKAVARADIVDGGCCANAIWYS